MISSAPNCRAAASGEILAVPRAFESSSMIGKGCVITIGGNEDKSAAHSSLLAEFVRLAGGSDARLIVIPSASEAPVRRAEQYVRLFATLGAAAIHVVHAETRVTPDDLLLIENATGIFVTGGDQEKLMACLRPTGCADAILNAVRAGAVYCGTSAGAAAACKTMLFEHGNVIRFAEGLGLLPAVIIDQHFSERQRLPRLLEAVTKHGLTGVGVDENTAVVWRRGGDVRVRGASRVTVVAPGAEIRVAANGDRLPV